MKNDIKIERYGKLKTEVHSELCTAEEKANSSHFGENPNKLIQP